MFFFRTWCQCWPFRCEMSSIHHCIIIDVVRNCVNFHLNSSVTIKSLFCEITLTFNQQVLISSLLSVELSEYFGQTWRNSSKALKYYIHENGTDGFNEVLISLTSCVTPCVKLLYIEYCTPTSFKLHAGANIWHLYEYLCSKTQQINQNVSSMSFFCLT